MPKSPIEEGNVNAKSNGDRGWIFGNFINPISPFRTNDFEIKWAKNPKGAKKGNTGSNKVAKTVFILVYGKFRFDFPELNKSVTLQKEGDYLFFENGVAHSWEALEDTFAITVRWPSLPNDQQ